MFISFSTNVTIYEDLLMMDLIVVEEFCDTIGNVLKNANVNNNLNRFIYMKLLRKSFAFYI